MVDATGPKLIFISQTRVTTNLKDSLPVLSTSMSVYKFIRSCGEKYIGRSMRRLLQRVSQHHPASLSDYTVRAPDSAITTHYVATGHQVNINEAFLVLHPATASHSLGLRLQLLSTTEVVSIRLNEPTLCEQLKFVRSKQLSWSPQQHT